MSIDLQRPLTYAVARESLFLTIQGEGRLMGLPMVFLRLAGCSLGCPQCDTDYGPAGRLTAGEIVAAADLLAGGLLGRGLGSTCDWFWITGGEPTDQDLLPLVTALADGGWHVGLATNGRKPLSHLYDYLDFLSVSPHGRPDGLRVDGGNQINLVPGLGGLRLEDWGDWDPSGFLSRYVTPRWEEGRGSVGLEECRRWVESHSSWRLGIQAHRVWGVP